MTYNPEKVCEEPEMVCEELKANTVLTVLHLGCNEISEVVDWAICSKYVMNRFFQWS